jgi:serine/threonine protein kinase
MMDEFIGKQIGGYEIRERIGKGGMATVYLALQTSMNRLVAIKLLPHDMMKDESYLQRFEREVSIVSTLEHRNIVPVYDHGNYNGQPYIIMRYMNAGSVDDLIRQGPLKPEKYLDIISQVAPALDYAHGKQVLHRDLKPSNILLDDDGGAYITDFGIARILGAENADATLTTQGVVGTPSYMSPEQAQGLQLDGRSDLYGLGVMLFEMATGQRPFQSDTPYTIAVMQVTTPPPAPRSINPAIPGAIEQVIYKALKKRPEDRYQTAMELSEALKMAISRPDFASHDTQKPSQRSQSNDQTQPNPSAQGYGGERYPGETSPSRPMQQVSPQQVVSQQGAPQNYAPHAPNPPSALYPPPTPAPMAPASVGRGVRANVRKQREQRMPVIGILLGALIGCGLLTAVVIAVAVAANNFLGTDSPSNLNMTEQAMTATSEEADETEASTTPEDEATDEGEEATPNLQDVDGTLYLLPSTIEATSTPDPSQPTSRPRPITGD